MEPLFTEPSASRFFLVAPRTQQETWAVKDQLQREKQEFLGTEYVSFPDQQRVSGGGTLEVNSIVV